MVKHWQCFCCVFSMCLVFSAEPLRAEDWPACNVPSVLQPTPWRGACHDRTERVRPGNFDTEGSANRE